MPESVLPPEKESVILYYCQGVHKRGKPLLLKNGKCRECGIVNTVKSTFMDSTVNSSGFAYPIDKSIKLVKEKYDSI